MGKKCNLDKGSTSWQPAEKWYKKSVGLKGQFYQQEIIFPKSLRLLELDSASSVLDLGCGQGVLGRHISPDVYYQGIDAAPSLIQFAKKNDFSSKHHYLVANITHPLENIKKDFTHATLILALQNIDRPETLFRNASEHLILGGKLLLVMNHPCFRIPQNSSWGIDEEKKIQYRRVNTYMSKLKIPLKTNPSLGNASPIAWSFHHPLSYYSEQLHKHGFVIIKIEEWISPKKSEGKKAEMENRSRNEFPLFMTILAKKHLN